MSTIMRIAESLVIMNDWTVSRLDIQGRRYCDDSEKIESYVGYLDIKGIGTVMINNDGTFHMM